MRTFDAHRRYLPAGLIFQIAADADITTRGLGEKRSCRCPFHDDRTPSAFLSVNNVFGCSVCFPATAITAKEFCSLLGLNWTRYVNIPVVVAAEVANESPLDLADARLVWSAARTRMLCDHRAEDDRNVYEYLARRGLGDAWDLRVYGVLGSDMSLPASIAWWPSRGYRVVVPLFDLTGEIVNVQARTITSREPKTLFPPRSHVRGSLFADARANRLLRSASERAPGVVVYGEGLTDFLALAIAAPMPVLSTPGISTATAGVSEWCKGMTVFLAFDNDESGDKEVEPTTAALIHSGAVRVLRIRWPLGCKDACEVVERVGMQSLQDFLSRLLSEVV